MAKKTLLGKLLKHIGQGGDAIKKATNGPPTPTDFQSRWLTTEELIELPDHAERNELAKMREDNYRNALAKAGHGGFRH